jgi:TolB-like protein/Tfp pilus assembly protein PilF
MIGESLGRYRIVERLGEGGMGTVFRAQDPRLERDVAIKVLRAESLRDESARRRFRLEARALSRLLHPHIATLFDIDEDGGRDFLVLEFVDGETLAQLLARGPLPEPRARAIGMEVTDALQAAHEQGLVHRDLKPGNVIITPRGRAKVLDFGLSRFLSDATQPGSATTASGAPELAGTLAYMAPEQIQGGPVDPRTDLWALGVLLFEMTAGVRPFSGEQPAALLYSIVHDPAPRLRELRPGVSAGLEAVVARCLEKSPELRFGDAGDLLRALREGSFSSAGGPREAATESPATGVSKTPAPGVIRSLLVLPFENRSGDPAQEFFVDGMTDALITDLAQIGALRVISRTTAMRFKGASRGLSDIARELRVDAVVEGSVLGAGDRVRVRVHLIEAATDRTLWAGSHDRDLMDILSLQSDLARAIAEEIRVQVTPEEHARLGPKGPVNPAAHVHYLKGRFLWNRYTAESFRESVTHYEEALALDPGYAIAYAGLADSLSTMGNTHVLPPGEAYPRARLAAENGLALDDSLAELHASLAFVRRFYEWDWPGAEHEHLRALDLNPGNANARSRYAQFLAGMGRHGEAITEAERALELDPLSLIIHTAVGDVLFYARRYDRAIDYYRRCLGIDPTFEPGHTDLARALEHVGRVEEAIGEYVTGTSKGPGPPSPSTGLAILYARAGRREEAQAMMEEVLRQAKVRFVSPYGIASYHAVTGDIPAALDWLEQAYQQRDGTLVWLKVHPRLDVLRGEPRFRELLARMRLES